jgi:signal transduction histidine kinase
MPEKYDDEEFRDTFSKIVVKEIERINSLINDLLDFSAEKESGRINEFELTSFIDDIVEYTKDRLDIDNQNILIQKVYNSASIDMYGDVEKLKQAFMNIFNNGCQAMNGEGVLTVNIKPNAKNVEISIKDTGEGIHPDDIPKIFDPFVTTKEMGVGLGLAISKRVIEDHNGKIGVNSKLSSGTKFTVSLPMPKA